MAKAAKSKATSSKAAKTAARKRKGAAPLAITKDNADDSLVRDWCALLYFGYHTVQGERGIIAYLRLSAQLERTEMALRDSNTAKEGLARRVGLLRPENLDRDMLDEQSRRILGLAHPDDIVVYTK